MRLNRLFHSKLQIIIFFSALILSTSIIGLFLCRIPNNLPTKIGAGFFTGFLEISMAYVLSLALSYLKRGINADKLKAVFLLVFYTLYVFIACLSAIMLFMSELNAKDTVIQGKNEIRGVNRNGYEQAVKDVKIYSDLMEIEKSTGAKAKFEKWRGLKERAEAARDRYEVVLLTAPQNTETLGNSFDQTFPGVWRTLLIIIFGIAMAVIYVMQILTAWEIPLPGDTPEPTPTADKSPTSNEKCACGCGRPPHAGSKYHNASCRVRVSRRNKVKREAIGGI